jgi:nucleoside-diphosphate-sugar epimerase
MPRILVLGATGFLGSAIARALLLSGNHTVYGLSRSAAKSPLLAAQEVTPIVCPDPAKDPQPYLSAIAKYRIDVVIDATAAYGDSLQFLTNIANASRSLLSTFASDKITPGPKLGYIYISGAWVHGSSPQHVTDRDPVGVTSAPSPPADLVSWRPALERAALAARDVLDVCVIRPAQMYGYTSAAWYPAFAPIAEAVRAGAPSVQLQFPEHATVSLCHVDDVADAVRCAAEKIELIAGTGVYPIFDIVGSNENLRGLLQEFADVMGSSGKRTKVELTGEGDDVYLKALGSTVKYSSARAKQILGWAPRRGELTIGMEVYARAWESSMAAAGGK